MRTFFLATCACEQIAVDTAAMLSLLVSRSVCTHLSYEPTNSRINPRQITHSHQLILTTTGAPRTVRATIGDRTFPAAAASVRNSLPESVRASPSLQVFRSRLKTELFGSFARSYSSSD